MLLPAGASQEKGTRSSLEDAHGEVGASGSALGSANHPVMEKAPKTSLSPQGLHSSLILPGSLPRITAVPGRMGLYPPVAAFLKERRADEWSRREEAGQAGPLSPGMASPG